MSDTVLTNPKPMLQSLIGQTVRIRLKWGTKQDYIGKFISTDSYMNFLLHETAEWIDGKKSGDLGPVLIRCNNVRWIGRYNSGPSEAAEVEDTVMG